MLLLIDLGYEKYFHNGLSNTYCSTLSQKSAIPMTADEDAVYRILKNPPQCDRSNGCTSSYCCSHLNLYRVVFIILVVDPLVCTSLLFIEPPTKFFKRGEPDRISIFKGGFLGKNV